MSTTLIAGALEFKGRFLWDNNYFQLAQGQGADRLVLNVFSSQAKAVCPSPLDSLASRLEADTLFLAHHAEEVLLYFVPS